MSHTAASRCAPPPTRYWDGPSARRTRQIQCSGRTRLGSRSEALRGRWPAVMSRPKRQNQSPAACLSSLTPQLALLLNSAPRTLNNPGKAVSPLGSRRPRGLLAPLHREDSAQRFGRRQLLWQVVTTRMAAPASAPREEPHAPSWDRNLSQLRVDTKQAILPRLARAQVEYHEVLAAAAQLSMHASVRSRLILSVAPDPRSRPGS